MDNAKVTFPATDATGISQLVQSISAHTAKWPRIWFRGVYGNHPLLPKILRAKRFDEISITRNFRRMGGIFSDSLDANDQVNVVCLAQHYGLPTRLLDWTESLSVALYFAFSQRREMRRHQANSTTGTDEIFIWCLNPVLLNVLGEKVLFDKKGLFIESAFDEALNEHNERGVFVADSRRVQHVASVSFDGVNEIKDRDHENNPIDMPIAFLPHFFDKRIYLQRSCFTIHGRDTDPLEKQLLSMESERASRTLQCFRFPTSSLADAEKEFRVISPSPTTILGDMAGLVQEILNMQDFDDPEEA